MVLDILAAIGLKETGQYVAKDVLLPLLQGSLEDYAKDFFKSCIADAAGLAQQEPVQKALGKALKAFVELVEEELAFQGCAGAEIRDFYEIPLREFMQDADVKATLGRAFEPDCRAIDAEVLALRWEALDLRPLPEEFDWPQIGKQYVRAVKGILRSDAELRDLLKLHNQEAMRRGIDELVGIPPDFDLRKYQETLREQYGNLKLESLDTTGYAYNDLKLWRMFIPQDVRPCQEFNPKVYELPKDKLRELVDRGELDAAALDADLEAAQLETYHRSYREQPIQNVLEVIGRTTGQGQRSRPVADYAVVLGDPGSGKSTLLQYVALQWAEQPIRDLRALAERPLPLLIELRKYGRDRHDQKCSSVVEYLHQGEVACRLNQQQLHEVLQSGDAIALFDGVDEVFDPHLRDVVVTDIHRFTNDYPQVQVIVTSRWLGYKAQPLRDAGFEHYMLQDLTDEQVGEFVAALARPDLSRRGRQAAQAGATAPGAAGVAIDSAVGGEPAAVDDDGDFEPQPRATEGPPGTVHPGVAGAAAPVGCGAQPDRASPRPGDHRLPRQAGDAAQGGLSHAVGGGGAGGQHHQRWGTGADFDGPFAIDGGGQTSGDGPVDDQAIAGAQFHPLLPRGRQLRLCPSHIFRVFCCLGFCVGVQGNPNPEL
jgi:hypothetical protein